VNLGEVLMLSLTAWAACLLLITPSLELFVVLFLLGLLVARNLIEGAAPRALKGRVDLFVYIFLTIFFWIVARKVYEILSGL